MKNITRFEFVNQMEGDPPDKILSQTITGISEYVNRLNPDLVLIHGDRIEAVAASLVCATKNLRSAHIEGGEVSGTIDEVYRHCNTKLCTVHFVSSKSAKKRVTKLGEHPGCSPSFVTRFFADFELTKWTVHNLSLIHI